MRILEPSLQLPIMARTHSWLTLMSVSALLTACGGGQSGSADTAAAAQQKSAVLPIASIVQTTMPCAGLLTAAIENAQVTASVLVPGSLAPALDGTGSSLLPTFCKVTAIATPVPGSLINIELWMPTAENWNGRFQAIGNGGYAGTGTVELAMAGAGMNALKQGFAVATTDMGTTPSNILNADVLIGQPQRWIDWGSRATHLMTTVSKSLVTAFYGRGPEWSYFNGCSTGGQQGMMSAQRYPDDYDGILAGAPAANRTHLHTNFVTNYNALNATPNSRFTPASARLLTDAVVKACAAKTGGIEGDEFLTDPRGCDFDPGVLQCTPSSTTDCLHADQVEAARKIYRGTRTASDALIFPGLAMGSEASAFVTQGLLHEPLFASLFKWVFGPMWTSAGYDFDSNTDVVDSVLAGILNANNPSLDAFKSRGGKLLRYHGWADDAIPPQDSINAYKSTIAHESQKSPGRALQRTQDYYRLFMVPGLLHCEGGPGPSAFGQKDVGVAQPLSADASRNAMIALQRWVEGGTAPERLVATKYVEDDPAKGVQMTRPLCVYPKVARYKGAGPTNDESSFSCETSAYDAPEFNPTPAAKYLR
jgi:feruloyl esterase